MQPLQIGAVAVLGERIDDPGSRKIKGNDRAEQEAGG
jgi:hypothetical protein